MKEQDTDKFNIRNDLIPYCQIAVRYMREEQDRNKEVKFY